MTEEELKKIEKENGTKDDFVFMREEIKARPINRKKLARNTIVAAISAVVFGIVACVTFALIAPFVMEKFSERDEEKTEEVLTPISFPEETKEEDMKPEDKPIEAEEPEIDYSQFAAMEEQEIKNLINSITFTVNDYQNLYRSLSDIANNAAKSMVRVTPIKQNTDWLNNIYENTSELSGLILAQTENEIFIATKYGAVKTCEDIVVTFVNGIQARAELINYDLATDIGMLSVKTADLNEVTKESIVVATMGNSNMAGLVGSPVIAVGSPMGTYNSVNYGMVTANSNKLTVTDNLYRQIVTNIYGSMNASGIVINLRGDVVGIIDTKYLPNDARNLISAIGITELKRTFERLMNREDVVLLGITASDIPQAGISQGMPEGVFVLSVLFDSTAMNAGIQSGDIISQIGETNIYKFGDFLSALKAIPQGAETKIVVNRNVQGTYKQVELYATFEKINK